MATIGNVAKMSLMLILDSVSCSLEFLLRVHRLSIYRSAGLSCCFSILHVYIFKIVHMYECPRAVLLGRGGGGVLCLWTWGIGLGGFGRLRGLGVGFRV